MSNTEGKATPGCETCWKAEECPRAKPGAFCQLWQTCKPEPQGEDPNDAWRRGDEETLL